MLSRISRNVVSTACRSRNGTGLVLSKRLASGAMPKDPVPPSIMYPMVAVFFGGAVWYYIKLNHLEEEIHEKYGKVSEQH